MFTSHLRAIVVVLTITFPFSTFDSASFGQEFRPKNEDGDARRRGFGNGGRPLNLGAPQLPAPGVFLPPRRGVTALSAQINAQASMVIAAGNFLVSEAIARRHHAEAAKQEMANSLLWVHTYFERKEINRKYRPIPVYREQEDRRYHAIEMLVIEQPDLVAKQNVTKYLNWFLDSLATKAVMEGWSDQPYLAEFARDYPLSQDDIAHLLFVEGSSSTGQRLEYRAHDAEILNTRWPFVLRNPEFDEYRELFDIVRDRAMQEHEGQDQISWETANKLMQSVDALATAYKNYYGGTKGDAGRRRRLSDYQQYLLGKRYIQSLASTVGRVIVLGDADNILDAGPFQGESIIDLIAFMSQRGVLFAPPKPGDEATYRKVFYGMRDVFIEVRQEL